MTKHTKLGVRASAGNLIILGIGLAACGGDATALTDVEFAEQASLRVRLEELNEDLSFGARGEQVLAVYDYLVQYGYFPSDEMARGYPSLQPVVAEAPPDATLFDDRMVAAVRQLQMRAGLEPSGVVDEATRDLLRARRCSFPDGAPWSNEKFAVYGGNERWSTNTISWRVTNTDNDLSIGTVRLVAEAAFLSWANQTSLSFPQVGSGESIKISFGSIDGAGGVSAQGARPSFGGDITLDAAETWSVSNPPSSTTEDLQTVLLHEIGHTLGVAHAWNTGSTMYPFYPPIDRTLALDDAVAISSLYDTWETLPGLAQDIGVGAGGHAWIIGNTNGVHRWTGSNWETVPGAGSRIAVESTGVPWIVNADGNIYRRNGAGGGNVGWTQKPGCARDIGIGSSNHVWIVGCGAFGDGFRVFKWNGSGWDGTSGGAVAIAVSPAGVPWVVGASGDIFRGTSSSATTSFEQLPGCAKDIGLGSGNYAWIIGCGSTGGGFGIHVWDEQDDAPDLPGTPSTFRREWLRLAGGGTHVSVGPNARPWITNSSRNIFRTVR